MRETGGHRVVVRRGRPRVLRGVFITLTVGLLVLFVPFRLVRYLVAASTAVVLLSWLYSRVAVAFLSVSRSTVPLRGQKLEPVRVTFCVENRGILPLAYLTVRDVLGLLSSTSKGQFLVSLPAGARETLTYEVVGHKVGDHPIGPVQLSGSDPLGFFRWARTFDARVRLIVYPSVHRIETSNRRGLPAGPLTAPSKIYEDVTQFRSIREYMAGDEMRRINWKVTARMGKLFSLDFQPTLYFPVLVVLNQSLDDYPLRHRDHLMERACEVAASLIVYYVGLKQEVGLASTGEGASDVLPRAEVRSGYAHALDLMEIISCTRGRAGTADLHHALFSGGASIPAGCRVQVVGPRLTQAQVHALRDVQRRSHSVEHFEVMPNEAATPPALGGQLRRYAVTEYGDRLFHG
jgi:uncharacterized protein (DUF58 family)